MKRQLILSLAVLVGLAVAAFFSVQLENSVAQAQKSDPKFVAYRAAIKDAYEVDITEFKEQIKGGFAAGKPVTDYDLKQLLEGIKWERVHTDDNLLALEIAMDHLERIPDYYNHLARMEYQCNSEKLLGM
jgi:hypothetical protein